MCCELITDYKKNSFADFVAKDSLVLFVGGISLGMISYCALTALGISFTASAIVAAIPISMGLLAGAAGLYMVCATNIIGRLIDVIWDAAARALKRNSSS